MSPAWSTLRLFIILGWATAMLWITATEFDSTEWKAIGGIAAGLGGIQLLEITRNRHGKSTKETGNERLD